MSMSGVGNKQAANTADVPTSADSDGCSTAKSPASATTEQRSVALRYAVVECELATLEL